MFMTCVQILAYLRDGSYLSSSHTNTLSAHLLTHNSRLDLLGYLRLDLDWRGDGRIRGTAAITALPTISYYKQLLAWGASAIGSSSSSSGSAAGRNASAPADATAPPGAQPPPGGEVEAASAKTLDARHLGSDSALAALVALYCVLAVTDLVASLRGHRAMTKGPDPASGTHPGLPPHVSAGSFVTVGCAGVAWARVCGYDY